MNTALGALLKPNNIFVSEYRLCRQIAGKLISLYNRDLNKVINFFTGLAAVLSVDNVH